MRPHAPLASYLSTATAANRLLPIRGRSLRDSTRSARFPSSSESFLQARRTVRHASNFGTAFWQPSRDTSLAPYRHHRPLCSRPLLDRDAADSLDLDRILESLVKNKDNPTQQAQGCRALALLANKDAVLADQMVQKGAIAVLLDALKFHAGHSEACECACMALWNIAGEPHHAKLIVDQGGTSALLFAIKEHMKASSVSGNNALVAACSALRSLMQGPEPASMIRTNGGSKVLLQLLEAHSRDGNLSTAVIRLLCSIVDFDVESGSEIGQNGGILSTAKAMHASKDNPFVHQSGLGLIAALAEHQDNAEVIGTPDLVAVIESSMSLHKSDLAIQALACLALQNIAASSEENAKRLGDNGMATRIMQTMMRFPGEADMLERGAAALTSIAQGYPACAEIILKNDGISLITGTIKAHKQSRGALCESLRLVPSIVTTPEAAAKVVAHDGIALILQAMSDNSKDSDVLEVCCGALYALTTESGKYGNDIVRKGGARIISDVLKDFKTDQVLLEKAMGTLFAIVIQDAEYAIQFGNAGAVSAIISAMPAHKAASFQKMACGALFTLSVDPDNAITIVKNGGFKSILRAMNAHKQEPELQEWGCGSIVHVVVNADCAAPAGREGAIEAVLAAMSSNAGGASVVRVGCEAIGALSQTVDNVERVVRLGGIGVVVRGAMNNSRSPEVAERAMDILGMLVQAQVEYAQQLVTSGGIKLAVSLLGMHPNVVGVQRAGSMLLGVLSQKSEFAAQIVREGGAAAVARAMQTFSKSSDDLLGAAAFTLRNLEHHMKIKKA
jgi:hypothetical protein